MTMKISEVAPNEAMLVDLADQVSSASSTTDLKKAIFDLDSSYLEAARTMVASLSSGAAASTNYVSLTKEQIETYLEFDPAFAEEAKTILREFMRGRRVNRLLRQH